MTMFHIPLSDKVESVVVPEGEYNLKISHAEERKASTGRPQLLVVLENLDEPNAQPIFHNVNGVLDTDDPGKKQAMLRMASRFFKSVGYEPDGDSIDTNALVGLTFRKLVVIGTDQQGEPRNELGRF